MFCFCFFINFLFGVVFSHHDERTQLVFGFLLVFVFVLVGWLVVDV